MLEIFISDSEYFDESTNEFIPIDPQLLQLEHSLVSLHEWEKKWHKPFLSTTEKTLEESIHYIKCMTLNEVPEDFDYAKIPLSEIRKINAYIEDSMTATWFNDKDSKRANREIITAEIVYYWMISLEIPPEYRYWHLNSLLTLVRVCNVKNGPGKQMSKREIMQQNRALNASRRAGLNTRG